MALYTLTGCERYHEVNDAVQLQAEKLGVNVYCYNFSTCIKFFVKVLIETNVNIINNELNVSDVYRGVNYIRSLAKFT